MSDIKKLFTHSADYFIGQILILIAGFISFPIFTRLLTVTDYGIMNLVSITLMLVTAIAKLGINKGSARFYEEFNSGKRKKSIKTFYTTFCLGELFLSGIITGIYLIAIKFLSFFIKDNYIISLLYLIAVLIWIRSIVATFMSFLNAEQKSKVYICISIFQKYAIVALSIFFTFYVVKGLYGYYIGIVIAELVTVLFLGSLYLRNIKLKSFDSSFLKEALRYGLPLIAFEFAGIILTSGDRYLLQYYMGSNAVGQYSAGYNLSIYCSQLLIVPLALAIYPMYMEVWTNKGENETKIFLSKTLKYFLMFFIPIVFGIVAIGKELITVLASVKYSSAYVVLPYVITGILIGGSGNILGAGLYIMKKTHIITGVVISTGMINILLNIIMIPKLGIVGAAIATLLAYITSTFLIGYFSFKFLRFKLYVKDTVKYLMFGFVMFIIVNYIHINYKIPNLLLKIFSGIFVYAFLIITFMSSIRKIVIEKVIHLK